jgi:hypothetical protein
LKPRRGGGDAGTGLIGSFTALLAFLALVLFSVQLLMSLYTTSVVTSAAHEGARVAAARAVDQGDPAAVAAARARGERRVYQLLGHFGERVRMDWSASDADTVVLRIEADTQRFSLPGLRSAGIDHVDRTVQIRVEQLR